MEFGGRAGILNVNGLESAIARPYSGYYRRLYSKCAALLHGIIQNHPFTDGNKRTAWLLTENLIERSGYTFTPLPDERIDDMIVAVANGEVEFDHLADWFRERLNAGV